MTALHQTFTLGLAYVIFPPSVNQVLKQWNTYSRMGGAAMWTRGMVLQFHRLQALTRLADQPAGTWHCTAMLVSLKLTCG